MLAPAKRGNLRLLLPETPFSLPEGGIVKETERITSLHYVAVSDAPAPEREAQEHSHGLLGPTEVWLLCPGAFRDGRWVGGLGVSLSGGYCGERNLGYG